MSIIVPVYNVEVIYTNVYSYDLAQTFRIIISLFLLTMQFRITVGYVINTLKNNRVVVIHKKNQGVASARKDKR